MKKNGLLRKMIHSVLIFKGHQGSKKLESNTKKAMQINQKLLFRLLKENQDTEYGKKNNFREIKTIEDFKKKIPLTTYDAYSEYTERMFEKNETNLLTTSPIKHYNFSSGTTQNHKIIPYTEPSIKINQTYGSLPMALYQLHKNRKKKSLQLPLMSTMVSHNGYLENGISYGGLSEKMMLEFQKVLDKIWFCPLRFVFMQDKADILYIQARYALETEDMEICISAFSIQFLTIMRYIEDNYQWILEDIREGKINNRVEMSPAARNDLLKRISPNPKRANELEKEFKKGFQGICKRIWKSFSGISAISSGGFSTYTQELRYYLTDDVKIYMYGYIASEGLFAICNDIEDERATLLPDSCFFEFMPLTETDPTKTKNLDELIPGAEYELIITNQSGLYRYKMKDIIKVDDYVNQCPRIHFSRRESQWLNIAGEKVTEKDINGAFEKTSQKQKMPLVDYVVSPVFKSAKIQYEFLVEVQSQAMEENSLRAYGKAFLEELIKDCPLLQLFIKQERLGVPKISFLKSGTFAYYKKNIQKGTFNQVKQLHIYENNSKLEYFYKNVVLYDENDELRYSEIS